MWTAVYLPEASQEETRLPARERDALARAVEKLELFGTALGYPHSSAVRGATQLRELRPRAGRSPWRALYRIVEQYAVIAAIGPEANENPKGFRRACRNAQRQRPAQATGRVNQGGLVEHSHRRGGARAEHDRPGVPGRA